MLSLTWFRCPFRLRLSQLGTFKNAIWTWGHLRRHPNFHDFRFKSTAPAAIAIHPSKAWLSQLVNFKKVMRSLEEWHAIKFCFKLGKNALRWKLDLLLWTRDQETEFPVEACWLSQTDKSTHKVLMIPFLIALAWSTCTGFPLDRQSTRNTMLRS